MSIEFTEVQTISKTIKSVTCSRCKKVMFPDNFVEWQEYQTIRFTGGYGSVFGDGIDVRVDLCQQCLYDLIGDFVEYDESQFDNGD